jgi:iron complex outermembrane receptor protein
MVRTILLSIAAFCAATPDGWGQQTTSLSGSVRDPQQAAIPYARIRVYPQGAASPLSAQADEKGQYRISLPSGGTFVIEVEAEGFRSDSKVIVVQNGEAARDDVALEIAGVSTSVIVTAAGAAQTVDQISKAISVVDAQEILDRNEYTLSSILATAPGVQIRNLGGPGQFTSIRVRGLRPDATAVLIDGMRFRDSSSPQTDSSSFLSNLNFVAMDRVEVLRGSGSSLYGTNAAGGVVNLVTDQGGGRRRGMLQAEGGNLGLYRGRAHIGGGALNNRLKYSAGFVQLNVTHGVDGNDQTRSTGGQGFVGYDLSAQTSLSARFFGSDDSVDLNSGPGTRGLPGANIPRTGIVDATPLAAAQVEQLLNRQPVNYGSATYIPGFDDPDNRRSSRHHATAVKLQHSLSSTANFQVTYQKVHTSRVFKNGPEGVGAFQPAVLNFGNYVGNTDTIDARSNIQLGSWNQITAGYEFEREGYDDLLDNNLPTARVRTRASVRQRSNAVYLQDQLNFLGSRLQVSLSARGQFFRLERPNFEATGVSNNYGQVRLTPPPKALTGDVSLSYFIEGAGTKLRVHGGNAYRAAGLYERFGGGFYRDTATDQLVFTPYGDPFLAPDRYNSIDGGFDQYLWRDRARVSATYFYTRVVTVTAFDSGTVIRAGSDPYGRSFGYINGAGGKSSGLELSAESRPTRSLTLSSSYTYTRATTDLDLQVPGIFEVYSVPRHTFTFVATQRVGDRFHASVDVVGNSDMLSPFLAFQRAYRFPGFTKTDLSASYAVALEGRAKLYTRIENIFNRTYFDGGYLAPRATFVTGLSFQY